MYEGMQYDLIQGQGQGHDGAGNWPRILKLGHYT